MKNIHVIPTDKPSRLWINNLRRRLELDEFPSQHPTNIAKHIYITSDEEITGFENNIWVYNNGRVWLWQNTMALISNNKPRQIILTTDQDLIKDGVQAIDDEFLEWFVKNPSCEEVEVEKEYLSNNGVWKEVLLPSEWEVDTKVRHKTIIPKEKTKQKYPIGGYAPGHYGCTCVTCKIEFTGDKRAVQCEPCAIKLTKEETKQETLEEAAEANYNRKTAMIPVPTQQWIDSKLLQIQNFKEGTEWQQERMYSEEEVKLIISEALQSALVTVDLEQWFEQFKKK